MLTHLHLEAAVLSSKNMPIYYFHSPRRAFSQPIGSLQNHDGDAEKGDRIMVRDRINQPKTEEITSIPLRRS